MRESPFDEIVPFVPPPCFSLLLVYRDEEFFFSFFCGIFGRKDGEELKRKRRASLGRLEGGRVNGEEDSSIAVVDKIAKGV